MITIGDHIRTRRLDLKLTQKEVAESIGVDKTTVQFWENGRAKPSLALIPKIIKSLCYDPCETAFNNLGEEIVAFRRRHGLSQKKLAEKLEVDQTTLARWDRGEYMPSKRLRDKLISLLEFTCS